MSDFPHKRKTYALLCENLKESRAYIVKGTYETHTGPPKALAP